MLNANDFIEALMHAARLYYAESAEQLTKVIVHPHARYDLLCSDEFMKYAQYRHPADDVIIYGLKIETSVKSTPDLAYFKRNDTSAGWMRWTDEEFRGEVVVIPRMPLLSVADEDLPVTVPLDDAAARTPRRIEFNFRTARGHAAAQERKILQDKISVRKRTALWRF